jgi:hypothetical protein
MNEKGEKLGNNEGENYSKLPINITIETGRLQPCFSIAGGCVMNSCKVPINLGHFDWQP